MSASDPVSVGPTGFTIGCVAAALDIWHYWLADLRIGYCTIGWALNMHLCCWGEGGDAIPSRAKFGQGPGSWRRMHPLGFINTEIASCPQWHMWSGEDSSTGTEGMFAIGYAAYIGFAVRASA